MARERKMISVYLDSLDPDVFDHILTELEVMDEIQLLRLHCKINARLQKFDQSKRLRQFFEAEEAEGRPETMRPPSSMPPEAVEME